MLNNTAPITVVIPCWRCVGTIERAINSIREQTLLPEKVILVDDASGDGTAEFLQQLRKKYKADWVDVISLSVNSGPGPARNAGWDKAETPYVAFLDADDAWHPQKVELHLSWMLNNPEVNISGHSSAVYNEHSFDRFSSISEPCQYNLVQMIISNKMITRTVILKTSLPYRFKGKDVTEDYLLWLEMAIDNISLFGFKEPLAVSFRSEFSQGGYSGDLWKHERRELRAIYQLFNTNKLNIVTFLLFSSWSLLKYCRRFILRSFNK